ncbi:MAG TPA: hypothetical protein VFN67_38660 [Polyangiales bacterium]|jgi:hypothetical protein|nr:hypothetical protein [Polyangiales bacterium]
MTKHSASIVVFAFSAAVWLSAGCTDDFSRFQFGPKKPLRARDAGTQNVSDATQDGASTQRLPSTISAGARADGPQGRGGGGAE